MRALSLDEERNYNSVFIFFFPAPPPHPLTGASAWKVARMIVVIDNKKHSVRGRRDAVVEVAL